MANFLRFVARFLLDRVMSTFEEYQNGAFSLFPSFIIFFFYFQFVYFDFLCLMFAHNPAFPSRKIVTQFFNVTKFYLTNCIFTWRMSGVSDERYH